MILRKLKLAGWKNWPGREQEVIHRVLHAQFDALTQGEELDGQDIDQMICGLALAGDDLEPYFAKLIERPEALKSYFGVNANSLYAKRKLSNDSWRDDRAAMSLVLEWLRSPPVQAIVAQG